MNPLPNIVHVARREYGVRVRTRTFVFGTLLLVVGVVALAFVPLAISYFDRSEPQSVGIWVGAEDLSDDPVATLDALLNAPDPSLEPGAEPAPPGWELSRVADVMAARAAVTEGELVAVLSIERPTDGELTFTLYTEQPATGRTAQLIGQASTAIAIADRMARAGLDPGHQAGLFAPAAFAVGLPDPNQEEPDPPPDSAEAGAAYLLGFGMTILIFMMIILYGTWVAMSVVEEKSSRVMEVILNAATPFQLLGGKVLGVGAVAFTQYLALLGAGIVALLVVGPIGQVLLGEGGEGLELPAGLSVEMLLAFGVYGVFGFLLYAVLYAAAGSLVSRQEDVNAAVMPLTFMSMIGYFIGVYAATGLFDMRAGWVVALAQVPFVSPFIMLSRITAGEAALWEIPLSLILMGLTILAALWIASRIYAAGVLMYGQRPGLRALWRALRSEG